MKTIKSIGILFAVLTGILCVARGEEYRTDINPALLYYQSFLLTFEDTGYYQYLNTNKWYPGQHLPSEFGAAVSNGAPALALVRRAAHQTVPCDWGIDLSPGPEVLLPQLGWAKRDVVDSQYEIMWDLQNGNQMEARDDLLAEMALGRNVARTPMLISVLVEIAIEGVLPDTIAENFYQFSPDTLQQVQKGFDALPPRVTIAECVSSEAPIRLWYLRHLEKIKNQYPNDNAGAMNALHHLLHSYSEDEWEQWTNGSGGTIDGFAQAVRNSQPLFAKLGQVMALPYSEYEGQLRYDSQRSLLMARFAKSHNPFFLRMVSTWQGCRHREFLAQVHMAMVRAAIEYKLHGEAGLETVMDPCGNGPFKFQRFVFDGVDRGFELKSQLPARGASSQEAYIFVEKAGPPFNVYGRRIGQPVEFK